MEGQEGVCCIFPGVVPDDPLAPRVPAGPFGDVVDLAIDDQPPVGCAGCASESPPSGR